MPGVLIVYGSTDGQTRRIADRMGQVLTALGQHVQVVDSAAPPARLQSCQLRII